MIDESKPRRWGREPVWQPDPDSQALLDRYADLRRLPPDAPSGRTLRYEQGHLRSLGRLATQMAGPRSLRALRDDPDLAVRIFREWPMKASTGLAYLRTHSRLIRLTVEDEGKRSQLAETILAGLYPTPLYRRTWIRVPRTVGGGKGIDARRPVFWAADVKKIVESAGSGIADEKMAGCYRAIVAVLCYSALKPGQLPLLKRKQILWVDDGGPWCAVARGVAAYGRTLDIPIGEEGRPYLEPFWEGTSSADSDDYFFRSPRRGTGPLSYDQVRYIVKRAAMKAGLPVCDDVTLKRAYLAILKLRGLPDYVIRDAFGFRYVAPVDKSFMRYRWAMAQRKMAERYVVPDLRRRPGRSGPHQLPLPLDGSDGDD